MRWWPQIALLLVITQPAHAKDAYKALALTHDQGVAIVGTVRTSGVSSMRLRFSRLDSGTLEIARKEYADLSADGGFIGEKPSGIFHAIPMKAGRYLLTSSILSRSGFGHYATSYCQGSYAFDIVPGQATYVGNFVADWSAVTLVPESYAEANIFAQELKLGPMSMAALTPTRYFIPKARGVKKDCLKPTTS